MTWRLNRWLLALILLVGLPYYWLLLDNHAGNPPAKPIEIAELRSLASSKSGPSPQSVTMQMVAFRRLPGTLIAAGIGLKRQLVGIMAFHLTVPGRGPIVIDSGITRADADEMGMEQYYPDTQRVIDQWIREASLVMVTHEHIDHIGRLAALAINSPEVLAHARLNPHQLPPAPLVSARKWPEPLPTMAPMLPEFTAAVAPGVVVIPAPSHTPGSQMIYVRLANGREYLFTGDIATLAASWQGLRGRSRLVGQLIAPEDRREVRAWQLTIRKLKAQAPSMTIVPGHDFEWIVQRPKGTGITSEGPKTNVPE